MGKHDNEGVQTGFEVYTGDAGCDHGRIAQIDILYQRTALLSQPHCPRREQRGQQATLLYRHLQPQTPALPTETTAVAASDSPSLAPATTNTCITHRDNSGGSKRLSFTGTCNHKHPAACGSRAMSLEQSDQHNLLSTSLYCVSYSLYVTFYAYLVYAPVNPSKG